MVINMMKATYDDALFVQKLRALADPDDGSLIAENFYRAFFETIRANEITQEMSDYFFDHLLDGLAANVERHGLILVGT